MSERTFDRRQFLTLGGVALTTALAGCGSRTEAEQPPDQPGQTAQPSVDSPYSQVYREVADAVALVRTRGGQGTGWAYDDEHLVTNAHVVGSADSADVQFEDGQWHAGEVVGIDPHSDLAAIALDDLPDGTEPLSLAEEPAVVGQEVVAIGSPYSLDGSVTAGIVSGVDRSIPAPTGFRIPDGIQTDAAVNPGNSGGPLVSLDGDVLAVVNSGGGDNIAFGISAPLVNRVVPELIESGSYRHPYIGAAFAAVTPAVAAANELDDPRGILVTDVAPGGPAAGTFQPPTGTTVVDGARVRTGGDVLVGVDDVEVVTAEDLGSYLALNAAPGDTVSCRLLRDGAERTVEVELGVRPARPSDAL
ncbi:S1C family serine protease [Natronoarchaeum rubrum]|uniref:S1C family serine protease n=1 Tax=Natronoarchaeum rubrum TaxID=755311 RepID=UPI0021115F8F|nr:trypsin-like peptidase domain-containing protein [Natronoarchaeum rubrum]